MEFGEFELDRKRGELLRRGQIVPLRRKTFEVLCYLAARRTQLVSKDELLDAVWRGAVVSENVLSVCISELRHALDDRPRPARFIETAYGRGYRFVAAVSFERASGTSGLVGRDSALARLEQAIAAGQRGERQSVFIEGRPASAKPRSSTHSCRASRLRP